MGDPRLEALADRLQKHIGFTKTHAIERDFELEREIRWHVNGLMEGDGGISFLNSHHAALKFIVQLLRYNCAVGENVPAQMHAPLPTPHTTEGAI